MLQKKSSTEPSHNNWSIALELSGFNARTELISTITGLPANKLKIILFNKNTARGPLPYSPKTLFKKIPKTLEATFFLFFFRTEKAWSNDDSVKVCINAYRKYSSHSEKLTNNVSQISFTEAWMIAKWSDSGSIRLEQCSHCHSARIMLESEDFPCAVCRSY